MSFDRNSYRNIIKATSIFGGVQLIQIFISVLRSKVIAVLLGPTGVGVLGLITSSTSVISSITGFGLNTSGVREISQAYASNDENRKNEVTSVLRKLVIFTGILGTLITFLLAPNLSIWAFGSEEYTLSFRIVSVILFFNQIFIGYNVLLQGSFRYADLAKSSLLGSLLGLFLTLPCYYIWKLDGIVPAIVISSMIQLILTGYFARNVPFMKLYFPFAQFWEKSKGMITLGFVIALTGFSNSGKDYLLRVVISNIGNVKDVGLFTAGIAISSSYVGMIFNAMGTDYAPRLASIADQSDQMIDLINKQAILLVTILAPLVIIFILSIEIIIELLYSSKFIEINEMVQWIMFGMIFRAVSWSLSFSIVAKGESKLFFWNELVANIYSLLFSALGYVLFGLTGLGVGFVITYFFYSIQMFLLARSNFQFRFDKELIKISMYQIIICSLTILLANTMAGDLIRYLLGGVFFSISLWISLIEIDRMIGVKKIFDTLRIRFAKIRE